MSFSLVLAVLLVRVWFFITIWPRNLVGASVMHFVSPPARWNVDLGTILPLSSTIVTHLEGSSLRPRSLQAESMPCRAFWWSAWDFVMTSCHVVSECHGPRSKFRGEGLTVTPDLWTLTSLLTAALALIMISATCLS